jgi:hypothetical protein
MRKRARRSTSVSFSPRHLKKLAVTVIVLFLIGAITAIYHSSYLNLQSIECRLDRQATCPPEIEAWLQDTTPRFILALNTARLKRGLLQEFPQLETVDVAVLFPHQLKVDLAYYRPVIAIDWPDKRIYYSASALPLPVEEPPLAVPIVKAASQSNDTAGIMEADSSMIQAIIEFNQQLGSGSPRLESISIIDAHTLEAYLQSGFIALLNPQGDVSRQVATLQAILETATMNLDKPYIDVRFDKPVLRLDYQDIPDVEASGSAELEE